MDDLRGDALILDNLILLAKGVAAHFGEDCEVVIHDLKAENPESTIVYIENGKVSGRKPGDGPSAIVLKANRKLMDGEEVSQRACYLTRTRDGRVLKSSTVFIKGTDGKWRYLFGINYDITRLSNIQDAVQSLIDIREEEQEERNIPNTVNGLLDSLIGQSVAMIGKQPALMTKDEKIRAIRFLNEAGAFLITKSGDKVSEYFGISKFTLYSYIDIKKKKG